MFSLSSIIRMYIVFSIVVMMAFFVVLTSIDVIFTPVWDNQNLSQVSVVFQRLYVTVIIMALIGIVYGLIIMIFVVTRGLNKYQDLLRRFDGLNTGFYMRPSVLSFPSHDEFGNLGEKLNAFVQQLDYYDQIKTEYAQLEKDKFRLLGDRAEFGVLLINTDTIEPYISYYNNSFRDTFLKKSVFIDSQGKSQTQYFSIETSPITYLNLKNEDKTPFFDDKQLERINNDVVLLDKTQISHDVVFTELAGSKQFSVEELVFIPFNNNVEKTKHQVLYLFINPKPVDVSITTDPIGLVE